MMEEYVTINALTMSSSIETIYSNSKGAIVKTILLHPTNSDVKKATLLFDGVAFDFELLKAKEEEKNILRSYDEEIRYITKGSSARGLVVNVEKSGRMNLQVIVYSEAWCLVNRVSRRVTRVEDFGNPYISVRGAYRASFENGGYNINGFSDTKARFSATGEFYITYPTITVGGDIVSIAGDNVGVTNPMTISTSIDWD